MNPSTKSTLLSLAESKDPGQIAFCLDTLSREHPDDDFFEILKAILPRVCSPVDSKMGSVPNQPDAQMRSSLEGIRKLIGQSKYLQILSTLTSKSVKDLPLLLSPINEPLSDSDYDPLLEIANWPDIPEITRDWFAQLAFQAPSPKTVALLTPLLRSLADSTTRDSTNLEHAQVLNALCAEKRILECLAEELASKGYQDIGLATGIIIVLGHSANPVYISLISPYMEDAGVWDRFADVMLTKNRLNNLFERASETGLRNALTQCWQESARSGKDLATVIAEEREVNRCFARLLSSRSTFIGICRTIIDPAMVGVLKEMFSDNDLPCRRAAASALNNLKTDAAIPFLKIGLVDRDKKVREVCASALQSILGQERFYELVEEMNTETISIKNRLNSVSEWAQESLSTLLPVLSSTSDSIKEGAAWFGRKARSFFDPKVQETDD